MQDRPDYQDLMDNPVNQEIQDQLDHQDQSAIPVHLETTVKPVNQEQPVHPVQPEKKAFVPNIARSMVESSLRMELDVVKLLSTIVKKMAKKLIFSFICFLFCLDTIFISCVFSKKVNFLKKFAFNTNFIKLQI